MSFFFLHQVLSLGIDIASAMAYLHPGVVHRDLKPQNVLLDNNHQAKVCDFGIAKFKDSTFMTTKNVTAGTPAYMAPEMFEGCPLTEKVDVFSFAVMMWESYTGHTPWKEYHNPMQVLWSTRKCDQYERCQSVTTHSPTRNHFDH